MSAGAIITILIIVVISVVGMCYILNMCIEGYRADVKDRRTMDDLDQEEYEEDMERERKDAEIIDYGWAKK